MWILFRFELRHILRDITQVLIVAVTIPMLLAPFVSRSIQHVTHQAEEAQKSTFFVSIGGPKADQLRNLLPTIGRFRELPLHGSADESLKEGLIDCYVTVEENTDPGTGVTPRLPETPLVTIHYSSSRERSWRARDAIQTALMEHLKAIRNKYLQGLGQDPAKLYRLEPVNLASRQQEHLQTLSSLVPIVLIFVFFGTGSVTALDAIAGERERGSLATVLVSALSRTDIALAKWLTVVVVSLCFGILQFIGIYFSTQGMGGNGLAGLPATGWLVLTVFGLLLCLQVSAILLWISVRSNSFKQAQLLYMPALLVTAAMSAVSWMQSLPIASVVAFVPISGLALALRDALLGEYSPWLMVSAAASLGWTYITLQSVADSLELDGNERPHSDDPKEQMRVQLGQDIVWFYALVAAVMVVLPGNFPVFAGLRGQVLLNQGMMLCVPLLLLKFYRQPVARSIGWRSTSLQNWTICLLAAPLLHICANSVAIISSWLLPMSEDMVRQMTELLLPENTSQLELFLLIAVSPAICEEIAFRGCFLHALQRPVDRVFPSWRTCLLVGLGFGIFHFSLQRLLPTAVIGTILSFVALRTQSLWPCMLLHFVNNGLAVGLHSLHLDYAEFPAWTWIAAWALLLYLLKRLGNPAGVGRLSEESERNESMVKTRERVSQPSE
ncbi:CPBP family intramembrane metalloprotease [bacterium]|nr:CPBP family intramembrane metalloprotease [bacterium]